ncbi:prepilin-type N-terminal cleavage/methylation domain-containing protein [Pseudoalteromonas luteoviolacea]|uniref:Prepilin-type N-terminal cleavage/methylation domain-containing protein n=2 Tax=Pseudoalteromonas luteoviolacea TaxID=43657 RepID=A0A1C0TMQ6_9GAMM|nr:type IV pilin protein [Pseudoalteromonas luteoviolacea]MBQ4812303.1 type IV pilin protein [Pseudoalteromonas luteoviolacea]OCQ19955.1 prepilin-type N-terminal cleavage/methylation domain-containing protein [Pseudoalteromonas luteoviolacea]
MMKNREKSTKGFTLIELMIVVAILGILATLAYPNYQGYLQRGARAEAMTILLDAANKQEQYFVDNREYASSLSDIGVPTTSGNGYFNITVILASGGYTLTATAANGPVKGDLVCTSLSLNNLGIKSITGTGSVDQCWER